jgi:hypothetical protein
MAQQQHHPGGHWSAANPIPTIQKFVENLDREKKERDRKVDDELRIKQEAAPNFADVSPHRQEKIVKRHTREVTDPTTGREIEIEDVGKEFMKDVKDPKVRKSLFSLRGKLIGVFSFLYQTRIWVKTR